MGIELLFFSFYTNKFEVLVRTFRLEFLRTSMFDTPAHCEFRNDYKNDPDLYQTGKLLLLHSEVKHTDDFITTNI